jgi:hypothetical protein
METPPTKLPNAWEEIDTLRRQLALQQEQLQALVVARLQAPPEDSRPAMKATDRPRGHRLSNAILLERLALVDTHDPVALAAYDAQLHADGLRGASPPELFRHTAPAPPVRQG